MKVANIFTNNTPYKNIYDFIAKKLNIALSEPSITAAVIKLIIMPGAYGQTNHSLLKEVDKHLKNQKN